MFRRIVLVMCLFSVAVYAADRPNVVLVMTDDQGYCDIGRHGNDVIDTPHLDQLYDESVRFSQFYVSPVCAPTRASLMTGRYNYRTGVVDTYLGRAMMFGEEVTIAEMLQGAGYRTGIFGKWHLGDNYPLRAMDNGFEESLIHMGGGIGQPSDPPGNKYDDPILSHNGVNERHEGYCTDIFTDAAIEFIREHRDEPFLVYLATNAPHTPLEISDAYADPYREKGLSEGAAKTLGMVTNIDDNVGKLRVALDEMNLADNTIFIFLTDNGPQFGRDAQRYNAGLRAQKGSAYDGGIRVPCFVHWPARVQHGRDIDRIAAHIDLTPTLLDACGVTPPVDIAFDGVSLMPLLEGAAGDWPDRTIFLQWHRGDEPRPFENSAVRSQRFKLVNGEELYDMSVDPGEKTDVHEEHPDVFNALREAYTVWIADVSSTRGYDPPRIHLGTPNENPVTLTRQDWRGPKATWKPNGLGYWEVLVTHPGPYDIAIRFDNPKDAGIARLTIGDLSLSQELEPEQEECIFENVTLSDGPARLEAELGEGDKAYGVKYVDVTRREP
jgi:arylsulfatase A-like enzyme